MNALSTNIINLTGNEFNNTITGNDGQNVITGGAGADTLVGRGGNDTYIVDSIADVVTEAVGGGTQDRVQTSATYVLGAGSEIEVLETTNATGTTATDLVGNEFANTIIGNNGTNTIVGYGGRDVMTGNGSGDTFVWTSTAETGVADADADVVTDFSRVNGDLIALNPIDADGNAANGDTAFAFVAGNGSAFTGIGQINWSTDGINTYIHLNTDVDLDAEATIRVNGVQTVDASWFVL